MMNPMDLTGKKIILTGASSGIGKSTAILLSKLGANLLLVSRNSAKLQETMEQMQKGNHKAIPFDLANINGIEEFLKDVILEFGAINGLVHCAGIRDERPLQMTKFDYLHEVMQINFYAFVELARVLSKKKNFVAGASFVAVSSVRGLKGDKALTAYSASKGALDSAIRAMAHELAAKLIRINSVVPSYIKTDMYEQYISTIGADAFNKNVLSHQYLGLGEPNDIANTIAYLLSDASRFITGTGLVVDGGYLS
jgi:NAD(P)-dependent dehydrogenase (short-subunit alcohol dehydrogenase family)